MIRKIYVNVTCRLIISADEGIPVDDILNDMDYEFTSNNPGADIIDMELKDWEVTDSK